MFIELTRRTDNTKILVNITRVDQFSFRENWTDVHYDDRDQIQVTESEIIIKRKLRDIFIKYS